MTLLSLLIAASVTLLVGRALVRWIGWPVNRAATARWCWALLACAVVFSALPGLLRAVAGSLPPVPPVPVAELVPALAVLGLAALGYVGWGRASELRAERARRDAQASAQLRRRALPAAPAEPRQLPPPAEAPSEPGPAETGFRPRGRAGA